MTDPGEARARIRALRAETERRLLGLRGSRDQMVEAARDSNVDDEHDPEGATIAFERAQLDVLSAGALTQLAALDAALARIEDGTYGICETCGEPIAPARLEVRPAATRCVRHA